jgi:hypothetical protein
VLGADDSLAITDVCSCQDSFCTSFYTGPKPDGAWGRRIPFIKWGHLLRFNPDEIEAWIAQHSVGALRPFDTRDLVSGAR